MLSLNDPQPFPVEDDVTEYKEEFNEKWKKEIAAFLNGTQIAHIYLGIEDISRKVKHVSTEDEFHHVEEHLGRWLSSSIYYPSPVGLVQVYFNSGLPCIEITPGKAQPYFLDGRAYVRNGSESIKASPERVTKMIAKQTLDTFDTSESGTQELTFDKMNEVFRKQGLVFKPKALGFYNSKSKFTNTALLMSDQNEFSIKVAVFDGLTVEQFKDRREITGSLIQQIDNTLTFIDLNNPLAAKITGQAQRSEQRSYPQVAIREAVINAVVHRSYFSPAPVQIEIFDDRMTILSPGALPGGMRLEAVLDGQTLPRNPQIVKILNRLKYIEDYGTGIRRIMSSYSSDSTRLPKFIAREDYVKVTLFNLNYRRKAPKPTFPNVVSTENEGTVQIVFDEQGQIIEYLKKHRSITRAVTEVLLNVKGTQANKYLKQLTDAEILKKVGGGPNTRYVLNRQILSE